MAQTHGQRTIASAHAGTPEAAQEAHGRLQRSFQLSREMASKKRQEGPETDTQTHRQTGRQTDRQKGTVLICQNPYHKTEDAHTCSLVFQAASPGHEK